MFVPKYLTSNTSFKIIKIHFLDLVGQNDGQVKNFHQHMSEIERNYQSFRKEQMKIVKNCLKFEFTAALGNFFLIKIN